MGGLDREAAKAALSGFVFGRKLTSNQIELQTLLSIISLRVDGSKWRDYVFRRTDLHPSGIDALFDDHAAEPFLSALRRFARTRREHSRISKLVQETQPVAQVRGVQRHCDVAGLLTIGAL